MKNLLLTVTMDSPLHIGGEVRQNTDAMRPVLKTMDGLPYIPATSVKGVLRHAVEALLKGVGVGRPPVCNAPNAERMCQPFDDHDRVCPACRLFGSPWREASLYFPHLTLTKEYLALVERKRQEGVPQTYTRTGIRINRRRHVVEEQFLFTTELFEPGVPWTFSGTVQFTGKEDVELTPLYLGARAVSMLGGQRSRGLGWCQVEIAEYAAESEDFQPIADDTIEALWVEWQKEEAQS